MENPLVTIMIPTYNQADYIEEAVESALMQNYSKLEVVVSDDNSTDNTIEVLRKFESDKRFKYFKNNINLGRVKNYHHMLYNLAQGKYALNLDGDDYLTDSNFISNAVKVFSLDKNIVLVGGKYKRISDDNGKVKAQPSKFDSSQKKTIILDGFKDCVVNLDSTGMGHLTELYQVSLAKKIGFYDKNYITADSESILRLVSHGKVGFINSYVAMWRHHTTNASQYSDIAEFYSTLDAFDSIANYALSLGKEVDQVGRFKYYAYLHIYRRIFRKIYQENLFAELSSFFNSLEANKVSKISLFKELGMVRKFFSIALKHPMIFKYLIK